tara:strand:- start:4128 stop:4781 length:654 start_codon:yes stop_codon:yes gene_type:complete
MGETIKKSLDNIVKNIKSPNSTNSLLSASSSDNNVDFKSLINTPVNSIINKTISNKTSLSNKTSISDDVQTIKSSSSFFTFRNFLFIFLLVILISVIIFYITTYFSNKNNTITNFFNSIFSKTNASINNTTKKINNSKTVSSINSLQNSLKSSSSLNSDTTDSEPEPNRTSSLNQGYCFIGKINDTRYCAKVNEHTKCMSGDIYPTLDICINPKLRI